MDNANSLLETVDNKKKWLITGVAGFIGSNLLEYLLKKNVKVVGLDNFATGYQHNLDEVRSLVTDEQWANFTFINGDIRKLDDCRKACDNVSFVLHQAALGSVPRSISDPVATNNTNVVGFLNMLIAARDSSVESFTYAASSSTYGDHKALPKVEENIGKPLSPYAVTKYVNEIYADVFAKAYNFKAIGLRYFNVFGKRQDPNGAYAAVIPKWALCMIQDKEVSINGDGKTTRDFCFVDNAVQANILAALASDNKKNEIYNVAFGGRTSLNDLFNALKTELLNNDLAYSRSPNYKPFREGDVRDSQADISKSQSKLGYSPEYDVNDGISEAIKWYIKKYS